ncbi:MAG: SDR family NAD(P)-dependent oxidoreductase [Treponema sp.]|jgi:3-oxoacyl-[acyl-carrier protein] reductase|nr:SDR family NAD(P)-dependent oxidoreductase [Treponema sp.]
MIEKFAGKKALIIGGTGGIGRELAVGLAKQGALTVLHGGSSQQGLESALAAIQEAGGRAEGFLYPADGDGAAEAILNLAAVLFGKHGGTPESAPSRAGYAEKNYRSDMLPDILVCAWGPFFRKPIGEMNGGDWHYLIKNNLIFPGILISLVINGMIDKKWGRILLFGGTNTDTIRGFSTTAAYSAAKTGLGVLAKSVARTAGPHGVTCNVICPGLTDTEYTDEGTKAYNRRLSPGGKALDPADSARMAFAVLENERINGAVIPVDAGVVL